MEKFARYDDPKISLPDHRLTTQYDIDVLFRIQTYDGTQQPNRTFPLTSHWLTFVYRKNATDYHPAPQSRRTTKINKPKELRALFTLRNSPYSGRFGHGDSCSTTPFLSYSFATPKRGLPATQQYGYTTTIIPPDIPNGTSDGNPTEP
jgi:hypothetical protein